MFAEKDTDLGCTDTITMTIDTGSHTPIKQNTNRTPLLVRTIVDDVTDDILWAKLIRPNNSPWASPFAVDKKDGSKRFCVDYRELNMRTTLSSWPLPVKDDLLASLGKAKYFTCLDLQLWYWQVAVDEKDKEKTAFASHRGLYEYNVMLFGLQNDPSTFQRLRSSSRRHEPLQFGPLRWHDHFQPFYWRTLETHKSHFWSLKRTQFENENLKLQIYAVRNPVPRIYCW